MNVTSRAGWRRLLALLALAAMGCSSGLMPSSSARDAEIEALKRQVLEQQKRATVSEVEAGRLKREITRLRAELEAARRATAAGGATLPGQADSDPAPEEEAMTQDLPVIEVSELEDVTPASPPPPAARSVTPPVEPREADPAPPEPPPEAQVLYDEGYTLFHQGRYAEAETRFRRYVEQYPHSDLADNAMFWIGECRYARGDFSSALGSFSDTVERYPDGNKVSDALLKAGKCLEALGETEQARSTYEEVVRRYPGSAAAALARDLLAAL